MGEHTDIRVRTSNPDWLDDTIQRLPNVVAAVVEGSWNGDTCTIRVLAGDPEYVRFAITNQGYGELVESIKFCPRCQHPLDRHPDRVCRVALHELPSCLDCRDALESLEAMRVPKEEK